LHGLLLRHVYPRPRELVLLDAPAEVLHARKREGTLDALRARRQEYLELAERLPEDVHLSVLDVAGSEEHVAAALLAISGNGRRTTESLRGA
jgi:hypothetical protein